MCRGESLGVRGDSLGVGVEEGEGKDPPNKEVQLVRAMLRSLLTHCLLNLEAGWTSLQRVAFHLRYVLFSVKF
jgi:hypothetical protein